MGTGTSRGQRALSLLAVVGIHGLIGWALLDVSREPAARADNEALQVVFLPAPQPTALARSKRRRPGAARAPTARTPATADPAETGMTAGFVARPAPAHPAPVVSGDDRWLPPPHRPEASHFARDPLASRTANLPARDAGRFRMHPPLAPADIVAAIGARIAPAGYSQDPCPRNRDNIIGLMDGRDPAALQRELAFERKHCRP
jgi:hypothetical protein